MGATVTETQHFILANKEVCRLGPQGGCHRVYCTGMSVCTRVSNKNIVYKLHYWMIQNNPYNF